MSVVTKTGDKGQTGLLSGERVSKASAQVETYGTLDELVSHLGFCRGLKASTETLDLLKKIQIDLFRLGAELASTKLDPRWKVEIISESDVVNLEQAVQKLEPKLNLPRSFVLPGGTMVAGALDIARSVTRRLERSLVGLINDDLYQNKESLIYINRLSDLLFILARYEHELTGLPHEPV